MKGIGLPVIAAAGIDIEVHIAIIKLAITYTLALAFVFTVTVTCLSLLGWVKFANKSQQKKLFATVIVQLAIGCLGVFSDFLSVSPSDVKKDIGKEYEAEIAALDADIQARKQTLSEQEALLAQTNKQLAAAQREVGKLQTAVSAKDIELAKTKSTLNDAISNLPLTERRRFQDVILRGGD